MTARARPRIQPSIGPATQAARVVTLVLTVCGAAAGLIAYPSLPDRIPIHWNAAGVADGWGSPVMLAVLIGLWVALVAGLEWLSRVPHILNYLVEVTQDNAPGLYGAAVDMLVWLNLAIAVLFGSLVAQSYGMNLEVATGFALAGTLVILVVGIVRMVRAARTNS
ncbi:DUF1648 domain-containing protein [Demequina flava]|uniref:DUF1648 domain-containing protein n=1 Tax=Demequina flava TaxID=1095025 RepID=UPI0007810E78|nr:DUF1648 domain-containing protein [Demequina flava]